MKPTDLASVEHWSSRYSTVGQSRDTGWVPGDYDSRTIEYAMQRALLDMRPSTILEVGCGNSHWLPYLAKRFSAQVAGIDYSPIGCRQAEEQLKANNIDGKVYCGDMFSAEMDNIGQFDFVYSLGLVEHFDDVNSVLERLLRFVRPGGILFTEIPNLWSVHGIMSQIYQPRVLAKHNIMTLAQLKKCHLGLNLMSVDGAYVGMFSLNLVAWGIEPRWPSIDRYFLPFIQRAVVRTDRLLCKWGNYGKAMSMLAPFIYVSAQKPGPLKA